MPNFAPVTGEVDVNTTTAGTQYAPAIARLGDGGYVIVWTQGEGDLYAQRFDALGNKIGGEVEIASGTAVHDNWPSVTALDGGGFAVIWTSYDPAPVGAHSDVRMRLFGADGLPAGDAFVAHVASATSQSQGAVTQLVDGSLIVTWSSVSADQSDIEVWGRKLDTSGSPAGDEFLLSNDTVGVQSSLVITALPDGGFVATWHSQLRHGIDPGGDNTYDVYARVFDANGEPVGDQFLVNTYALTHQLRPAIATLADGSVVIAWESHSQSHETDFGIWGQRFDADGNKIGGEFRIPNITAGDQGEIEIAALDAGGFVVSWMSYGTDGSGGGVYARIFDSSGSPVGDQFPVNVTTSGNQFSPTVAALANGRLVVAWQSPDEVGDSADIHARTFAEIDPRNDFNGDGRSDILWRHDSGLITDWLGIASGGFAHNFANAAANVATSWQVAGTGDFNGDGRADILWRHDGGLVTDWLGTANGGFTPNNINASVGVGTDWQVVGTGDFNGDGKADVLWRHDSGTITDWLGTPSGGFTDNYVNAAASVATSWQVIGTGDFNADGRADILWRHDSGMITDWLGEDDGGFTDNYANASASVATSWHVVGTGDFNGDRLDDLLWRHDSGLVTNWLGEADGGFAPNNANAWASVDVSWEIAGTGDYNGDGIDDILWRHDSGLITDWLGNTNGGFTGNIANADNNVSNSWHVQPDYALF